MTQSHVKTVIFPVSLYTDILNTQNNKQHLAIAFSFCILFFHIYLLRLLASKDLLAVP